MKNIAFILVGIILGIMLTISQIKIVGATENDNTGVVMLSVFGQNFVYEYEV